jgi:hypothetical protein
MHMPLSHRLHGEADDADDLADFMVDTDEEEDIALFSGRSHIAPSSSLFLHAKRSWLLIYSLHWCFGDFRNVALGANCALHEGIGCWKARCVMYRSIQKSAAPAL